MGSVNRTAVIRTEQYDFDAIVVGSGMTGGWAAKELTEKGLRVLVLERGKDLQHGSDYLGEHAPNWKLPFNGKRPRALYEQEYPIQSTSYAFSEANRQFWINDKQDPYATDEGDPFLWKRAGAVGGRSLMWGRQSYRFSEQDFLANKNDGHGIPWPVEYRDIAPWYSYVEKFIGVCGEKEGLSQLPDGEFQPAMPWFALEKTIKSRLKKKAPDVTLTSGRAAILTEDLPGRSACHYCGPCQRGCSTGSYFSSQSSTLPAARATGNLTLRPNSVVQRLEYDKAAGRISAVQVIDSETMERARYTARLIFLCASTIGSTQLLLNSSNKRFPNGLANDSGVLGHYMMDHHRAISYGIFLDDMDSYYYGNRPNGLYIPRFRNLNGQDDDADFVRGFGYQCGSKRINWRYWFNQKGIGAEFKESLSTPGFWTWGVAGFAEMLPAKSNRMYLSNNKTDRFDVPQVAFNFQWGENDKKMNADIQVQAKRILRAAGAVLLGARGGEMKPGGDATHEMGTARMGDDPGESVLNGYNQAHAIPNLFVTDGSFMTSASCVNPSLTYMAFTARACDYAVKQLQSGEI